MTITYVGAGTSATSNYASVTPTVAAGTTVGDTVLVFTSVRGAASGTLIPTGWRRFADRENLEVYGRIWQDGDVMPAFVPTGGAAGDDVIAQTITLRGVEQFLPDAAYAGFGPVGQTNASAQNIAYPELDVPYDNLFVAYVLWKADDSTAIATIAGMTGGPYDSVTTGNDASQAVKYVIQTSAASFAASSAVVSGGAAATSASIGFTLRPAATLTITEQTYWPPRALVSLTGLTLDDSVQIYRVVDGVRTAVRAGTSTGVTDSSFLVLDAELPFGTPVHYVAVVNENVEYESDPVTYTLSGGKVALTDAITGLSAEVAILGWPSKRYERRSTKFVVGGRNLVVSGDMGQFDSEITFYTETTSSAQNLEDLFRSATSGIVQIRHAAGHADIDAYVVINGVEKTRYDVENAADERRLWVADVSEVDPWGTNLEPAGYTYADLDTAYTDLTYADLAADYSTYLQLAQSEIT